MLYAGVKCHSQLGKICDLKIINSISLYRWNILKNLQHKYKKHKSTKEKHNITNST